jgi:hypothetical protein
VEQMILLSLDIQLFVSDAVLGVDVVYNYGAFDFSTPNFVMKFVKGDLQYFAVASLSEFINQYGYNNDPFMSRNLLFHLP